LASERPYFQVSRGKRKKRGKDRIVSSHSNGKTTEQKGFMCAGLHVRFLPFSEGTIDLIRARLNKHRMVSVLFVRHGGCSGSYEKIDDGIQITPGGGKLRP